MKKNQIAVGGALFIFVALITLYLLPADYDELNFVHKYFANRVFHKWDKKISSLHPDERAIVDINLLLHELNYFEKKFADKIFNINPIELGFKGPFYSKENASRLVKINSRKVGYRETGVQYCPKESYEDYMLMNVSMKAAIGRELYIDSGYRSPGRQAYLFFYYLVNSSRYSLFENAKWIAMPGYSEHGHPVNNAIDFCSANGINGFNDGQTPVQFSQLEEYKWLLKNANRFNFYLSYPENNKLGVAFEPWHWHWNPNEKFNR